MRDTDKILADIIVNETDIELNKIIISAQQFTIPNNFDAYVIITYISDEIMGNMEKYNHTVDLQRTGVICVKESYNIEVISGIKAGMNMAKNLRHNISLAFKSVFAKNTQRNENLTIFSNGSKWFNLSNLEKGSSIMARFKLNDIIVFRSYSNIKEVDYYDTFTINDPIIEE